MNVMPPDDARWWELWASLIVLAIVTVILAGVITYEAEYQVFNVYLDEATFVVVDMEHCNLRFIPARNYPKPDSDLRYVSETRACETGLGQGL